MGYLLSIILNKQEFFFWMGESL